MFKLIMLKTKEHSLSLIFLLILISFLLPWVKTVDNIYSGYALLYKFMADSSVFSSMINTILLLGTVLSLTSIMIPENKVRVKRITTVLGYLLFLLTAVMFLFVKKTIDSINIIETPFLVKHLTFGYWLFSVISFYGVILSMKKAKIDLGYIVLLMLNIIWVFPLLWIVFTSLRAESGFYSDSFIPDKLTLNNYISLLTDTSVFYYLRWFFNTLFVATFSCIFSTLLIISTSFVISRISFRGRKTLMNLFLILGMFPGFMAMIAVYYIIKAIGLSESLFALILVYSGGSALGYYIVKGYFDTIPKALDEAAVIEGATRWQILVRIIFPLSKPIVIYTILTSFIGPWADFIFASVILGDNYESYTVAIGLYTMLQNSFIDAWYTRFAAGSVLISIPIAVLFISLRKYYVEGLSAGATKG